MNRKLDRGVHLENTIERSVLCGDAGLCQIILDTCFTCITLMELGVDTDNDIDNARTMHCVAVPTMAIICRMSSRQLIAELKVARTKRTAAV